MEEKKEFGKSKQRSKNKDSYPHSADSLPGNVFSRFDDARFSDSPELDDTPKEKKVNSGLQNNIKKFLRKKRVRKIKREAYENIIYDFYMNITPKAEEVFSIYMIECKK
jgi:hypothetical protein